MESLLVEEVKSEIQEEVLKDDKKEWECFACLIKGSMLDGVREESNMTAY